MIDTRRALAMPKLTEGHGLSWFRDGHVDNIRLGDPHRLMRFFASPRVDCDPHGNGLVTDSKQFGVEAYEVTDQDWRDELNFVHGDGDEGFIGILLRLHNAGLVDVTED